MPNDSNKLTADEREELAHPSLEPTVATCVKARNYIEELEAKVAAHDVGEHPSEPSYETLRYQVEYWRDAAFKTDAGWKACQTKCATVRDTIAQVCSHLETALPDNQAVRLNIRLLRGSND